MSESEALYHDDVPTNGDPPIDGYISPTDIPTQGENIGLTDFFVSRSVCLFVAFSAWVAGQPAPQPGCELLSDILVATDRLAAQVEGIPLLACSIGALLGLQ